MGGGPRPRGSGLKRGEIWSADLGACRVQEQTGRRPVMIWQSDTLIRLLQSVLVVPHESGSRQTLRHSADRGIRSGPSSRFCGAGVSDAGDSESLVENQSSFPHRRRACGTGPGDRRRRLVESSRNPSTQIRRTPERVGSVRLHFRKFPDWRPVLLCCSAFRGGRWAITCAERFIHERQVRVVTFDDATLKSQMFR